MSSGNINNEANHLSVLIENNDPKMLSDYESYEEIIRLNNELINMQRELTKKNIQLENALDEKEKILSKLIDNMAKHSIKASKQARENSKLYEEMSKLNNELTNVQRELVKKNIQLENALDEKEMLLKEIHYRVKNNLMVISSLLNLQSRYIKDKEVLEVFREIQNRARSMALIHEKLYRSDDVKRVNFGDYIKSLTNDIYRTYVTNSNIELSINVEDVMLDVDNSIPLGLIVNELASNCMKHAFPCIDGKISITFTKIDDSCELIISDNGIGFPEDLDYTNSNSLGLQLVNMLVNQINGTIEHKNNNGTIFTIKFKEVKY